MILRLREILPNGMRPSPNLGRNSPYLYDCQNRRPYPDGGLKNFFTITQPFTDAYITTTLGETKAWPFPQLFFGKSVTLLVFSDALYTVDESDWTATAVTVYDPETLAAGTITVGRDWHFLDMGSTWMLFNGACVIWKASNDTTTWCSAAVTITSGLAHLGERALFMGFDASDMYDLVDWPTYLVAQAGTLPSAYSTLTHAGNGPEWVWASSMFAPDLLWLHDDTILASDLPGELAWRNEAHSFPVQSEGTLWGGAQLRSGVVVFGDTGVAYLEPHEDARYSVLRFAGIPEGLGIGVGDHTRTHWAGDRTVQFFVDAEDDLWALTPDLLAKKLGYAEYIAGLDRDYMLLTYDSKAQDLYISDGTKCLMLAAGAALCRAPNAATTLCSKAGYLRGISFKTSKGTVEHVANGAFASDISWTKGSGWQISGGAANTGGGAVTSTLSQAISAMSCPLQAGATYEISFSVTRSAGRLSLTIGATSITHFDASATYSGEFTFDGNAAGILFVGSSFNGSIDNVSIKEVAPVRIETQTFSTESGFIESISRVRAIGLNHATCGWKAQTRTRIRTYDDFTDGAAAFLDERSVAKPGVPVLEGRLVLTSADQTKVALDDLIIEVDNGLPDTAAKLAAATPSAATE